MKTLLSLLLVVAMVTATLPVPVRAVQIDDRDGTSMASHFAADTLLYLSLPLPAADYLDRLDEQFMQQIPDLLGTPTTLREMLNQSLAPIGTDIDSLFAMLGDTMTVAVGEIDSRTGEPQNIVILIEIEDREQVEALLPRVIGPNFLSEAYRSFTVFSSPSSPEKLAVNDEFLIFHNSPDVVPNLAPEPSLANNEAFRAAFAALPEEHYFAGFYADLGALMELDDFAEAAQSIALPGYAGPLAIGLTTLPDSDVVIMDSAQLPGPLGGAQPAAPIDLSFARFIPADTSLAFHATDLTRAYDSWLTQASMLTPGDPGADIEGGLAAVEIDLHEDILSWTDGDYASFVSFKMLPILRAAFESRLDINENLDFGLVIEATDPQKAQAFAATLGRLAQTMLAEQPDITIDTETIGGTEATVIRATSAITATDTLDLAVAIGASDDVFFIATRRAAEDILDPDNRLLDNPDYRAASQLFLPDPTFTFYSDAQGALMPVITIVGLALLGPAIGRVFEDIVSELENPPPRSANPEPQFVAQTINPSIDEMLALLESVLEAGGGVSVSTTVTPDGIALVRVVSSSPEMAALMGPIGTIGLLAVMGPTIGDVYSGLEAERPPAELELTVTAIVAANATTEAQLHATEVAQAASGTIGPLNATSTAIIARATAMAQADMTAIGPSPTPAPARTAQVGDNRGEVPRGGRELWHYSGQAGDVLTIAVRADKPANDTSSSSRSVLGLLDTVVVVLSPSGEIIAENDDIEAGIVTDSQIEQLKLPEDGVYEIVVLGWNNQTHGPYTLDIAIASSRVAAG